MSEVIVDRLKEYSEDDAAELGRLARFLSEKFDGKPIDKKLLEEIINSPYHDQLVVRIEGRIVGAATLNIVMGAAVGKSGYLEDFVTDPDVRRQGVGGRVWDEIILWCKEHDVDLDFTSKPSREDAHRFYLAHGAVVRETTVFHVDI
jgi:GNAT superfamily N-acetyltransferase